MNERSKIKCRTIWLEWQECSYRKEGRSYCVYTTYGIAAEPNRRHNCTVMLLSPFTTLVSWYFLCFKHLAGTTNAMEEEESSEYGTRANDTTSASWLRMSRAFSTPCLFFRYVFVAKRYIIQQKYLKKRIGRCVIGTRYKPTTVSCIYRPSEPQCTALQTDWKTEDIMMAIVDHTIG